MKPVLLGMFILAAAACFFFASPLATLTAEPADNSGTIETPAPEKPAVKILNIYFKGEDFVTGIDNTPVDLKTTWTYIQSLFEFAQDTKAVRKKYDKNKDKGKGYDDLRKEHGIDFVLENVCLFWNGKSKHAAKGEPETKYTDEEMTKVADYIVETTAATEMEEITWMEQVTHYKYYATVTVKVTDKSAGKAVFDETNKADYTANVKDGKKKAAEFAISKAMKPLAVKVIRLDIFAANRKSKQGDAAPPEKPIKEEPKESAPPKEEPKKETPKDTEPKKDDEGAEAPKPSPPQKKVVAE
jgi:vacuolar-type H+-ATPase subunit I/STV1